jgi:hypothetical protein
VAGTCESGRSFRWHLVRRKDTLQTQKSVGQLGGGLLVGHLRAEPHDLVGGHCTAPRELWLLRSEGDSGFLQSLELALDRRRITDLSPEQGGRKISDDSD